MFLFRSRVRTGLMIISGVLLLIGESNLDLADRWGSIIGGTVAVGVLVWAAAVAIVHWLRWLRPVTVRFFLPAATYALPRFPGAAERESTKKKLTIGHGTYRILVQIEAKTQVEISMARFLIDKENLRGRPIDCGSDHPGRWESDVEPDWLGRKQFRDWNGEIRLYEEAGPPGLMPKKDTHILAKVIETQGDWSGEIKIGLPIKGRHTKSMWHSLRLTVSSGEPDEAPFLKLPGPNTSGAEEAQDSGEQGS